MPTFDIIKTSKIEKTFRNESVKGQFDLKINEINESFSGNLDIDDKEWSIGLIVGSSGSGKTTIAKQCFGEYFEESFQYDGRSVIDNMPKEKTTIEITKVFNSVGFATAWSWLKPYHVLSNGEKMRVDLARKILSNSNMIIFDEFTSVVDRTVAKTCSSAISKAIKKTKKQFIAVSCHYDIVDWLEPCWIYDTDKKRFFFAQKNTKDQKLKLRLENVVQKNGSFLKNFII